jgi:glycosyltransferase involved in cell wall biosynthesis
MEGGAEMGTGALREGLLRRGIEARVFASSAGPNDIADHLCFGSQGRLRTFTQTANVQAWWGLRRVLREWRPDVVHVRMFLTQLSPLILPLLRDVPAIFHAVWYRAICPAGTKTLPDGTDCTHRAGIACLREGCISAVDWPLRLVQLRMLDGWKDVFRAVVANSHAVARRLEEAGIAPVRVIWNGVRRGAAPEDPAVLPLAVFAGRLVPEKGVDVLLRAFALVSWGGLLIAGDGPERESLGRLAADLGIASRVTFTGRLPQAEIERRFRGAWVQVVPSLWPEPFGRVAVEAMMRGSAVIASDTGGLSEVVEDGQTGLLVPRGDVDSLASALDRILGDRSIAQRMGQAGRRRAEALFDEDAWIDAFIVLYREVLQNKGEIR